MSFIDGIINFFTNLKNEPLPKIEEIRRQCKKDGSLFEDREFPLKKSLLPENLQNRNIIWQRPKDISKKPSFIDESHIHFYSIRWNFFAAVQAIRSNRTAFNKVVNLRANNHDMRSKAYVGAVSFMFWQFGYWKEVIIDDRIPTLNGEVCYFESKDLNEFWPPLIMKAYAKLYNSYEIFDHASLNEALTDLTGGLIENTILSKFQHPTELYDYFCARLRENAVITINVNSTKNFSKLGLATGNAYVLKRATTVEGQDHSTTELFCVHNPWVNSSKWSGKWSHECNLWDNVDKRNIYLNSLAAGEFYMAIEDIQEFFAVAAICHNTSYIDSKKYQLLTFDGQWIKEFNAGGDPTSATFYTNPQYRIKVSSTGNQKDEEENIGSMLVSLLRKPSKRNVYDLKNISMSFLIFLVLDTHKNENNLTTDFFQNPSHHVTTKVSFTRGREMVMRINLYDGEYCIVPFLREESSEQGFHLRIFAECLIEEQHTLREYNLYSNIQEEMIDNVEGLKEKTKSVYDKIATADGLVYVADIHRLLEILSGTDIEPPNQDRCWSLLRLFDEKKRGSLNFSEFINLLVFYRHCHDAFANLCDENAQTLKLYGVKLYFKSLGYNLSDKNFSFIFKRYANQNNELVFHDLLYAATKIEIGLKTGSRKSRILDLVLSI